MGRTFTFEHKDIGIGIATISDDEHGQKIERQPDEVAIVTGNEVTLAKSDVSQTSDLRSEGSDKPTGPKTEPPHM